MIISSPNSYSREKNDSGPSRKSQSGDEKRRRRSPVTDRSGGAVVF